MALIPTEPASITGVALTQTVGSTGGDTVQADKAIVLLLQNTTSASATVTLAVSKVEDGGLVVPNVVVTVPAMGLMLVGPVDPNLFANSADQRLHLTYSLAASIKVSAIAV
jgi:hypothetical protein